MTRACGNEDACSVAAESGNGPPFGGAGFPLLWLLVPQIAAFAFCGNAAWAAEIPPARWALAGTFFLFAAAAASAVECAAEKGCARARAAAEIWKFCFPVAAFFLFAAWWNFRAPPVADTAEMPPREAEIVLRVERSFSGSEKNFNGIARVESVSGGNGALAGTRVWYALPRERLEGAPEEGARIRAAGVLQGVSAENLSSEGFADFLRRERVGSVFSRAGTAELLSRGESAFARRCAEAKAFLLARISEISEPFGETSARTGRVLGAMMLGEQSLLSPEQKRNYLLTGTMHIFSVSGLHISILAAGLLRLFRLLRFPRVPAWLLAIAGLRLYVEIIGAPPPAERAWTMLVFLFLGTLFGRGRLPFHGLLFSAFFSLTVSPTLAENVGFRLSYFAVAAILLYGVPAAERAERLFGAARRLPDEMTTRGERLRARLRRMFVGNFCVSAAATLAGTTCIVELFGVCSLVSLLANLVLIPLVAVASWAGAAVLCAACLPAVGAAAGTLFYAAAAIPLWIVDEGTALFARAPGIWSFSFPYAGLGAFGGLLMLALFFFGAVWRPFRERPWLRFGLPPFALCVFLLLFAH